jgi:MoaA/NifB/PqqE/SkfB family radical SAM enzyme
MEIIKNRERKGYSFANINLLGKCNADCFFCLGKDIPELLSKHNQANTHFSEWKNFDKFLDKCRENGISKLYVTGQNMDSLQYKYLDELVEYLQPEFTIGIRTNGYLAKQNLDTIHKLNDESGFSINSLTPQATYDIMGRRDIVDWDYVLSNVKNSRVSIVINKYNYNEFFDIIKLCSQYPNVKYVQARRISTDTRFEELKEHIEIYEKLYQEVKSNFKMIREFYTAEIYDIYGKEVCFWRTVETSVNSMNYFTDGTISGNYFVIEGYLGNYKVDNE